MSKIWFALILSFITYLSYEKRVRAVVDGTNTTEISQLFDLAKDGKIEKQKFLDMIEGIKVLKNFMPYFECATQTWKLFLEYVYQIVLALESANKITPNLELPGFTVQPKTNIVTIPQYMVDISEKHDAWLSTFSNDKTKWNGWIKWYPQWYNYVNSTLPAIKSIQIHYLQIILKELESTNSSLYTTYHVHERFAAEIARSFGLMCVTHYTLTSRINKNLKNHGKDFKKMLLAVVPDWYVTQETVDFVNALRLAHALQTSEEIRVQDFTEIQCVPIKNARNEEVCVPYLDMHDCFMELNNPDPFATKNFETFIGKMGMSKFHRFLHGADNRTGKFHR